MKKLYSAFIAFLFLSLPIYSQMPKCETDFVHRKLMSTDSNYSQNQQIQEAAWKQFQLQSQRTMFGSPENQEVFEVPVVVHVIHTGGAIGTQYNPTDADIEAWIESSNQIYETDYLQYVNEANGGTPIPIRLVLAKRDPDCNPTNGIMRVDGSGVPGYLSDGITTDDSPGAPELAIKNLSRWPAQDYYNIWLVKEISGGGSSGYAYLPGAPSTLDGTVVDVEYSKEYLFWWGTLPHEIAHAMGLYHTFEGSGEYGTNCPVNNDCTTDGDKVCDTEPHKILSGTCPTGINPCTGQPFNGVQYNLMAYTNCPDRFTPGQRDRMLFFLHNYRASLLTSLGLIPPGVDEQIDVPTIACVPTNISEPGNPYDIGPRMVSLANMTVTTQGGYTLDDYQYYIDHTLPTCTQSQPVAYLDPYIDHTITVSVNGMNQHKVFGWIDFNNNGVFETNERIINSSVPGDTHTATFNIPAIAVLNTSLRMRITADFVGVPDPQPCTNPSYGQIEDFIVIITESEPEPDYVFENGNWTPENPTGVANSTDNILVINGSASGSNALGNTDANNITIMEGASLDVKGVLNVQGDLTIDGDLVFLSGADYDGELGVMAGTITGEATVHRYMMNKRSFRVVASSVTTTTSIHDNWQEGATSKTHNPVPGYGTHITGTTGPDQTNGFDATTTGTPSMYRVNYTSQSFEAIDNTDENTLTVGNPYLLFVRGDRDIDLTNNEASSSTILRAKGELHQGDKVIVGDNHVSGDVLFITNPYQCAIDLKTILQNNSTNVNSNYFYLYDPAAADYGRYITYDVNSNSTSDSNTAVNQYLQPGQAVQVLALGPNPTVTIKEVHKAPSNHTATQRSILTDKIEVQLYTSENYSNNGPVHDSFGIYFDVDYSNEIDIYDAVKPMNFSENFGIDHNGSYFSIEQREMPQAGEIYPLYSSGYAHDAYTLKMTLEGLEEYQIYLDDEYTGRSTLFVEGDVVYAFTIDENPLSRATDRFSIRVEEKPLGIAANLFQGISLFPNPSNQNTFYISAPQLNGQEINVSISDMSGRQIYKNYLDCTANKITVSTTQNLASGIYLVTLKYAEQEHTLRLVKE